MPVQIVHLSKYLPPFRGGIEAHVASLAVALQPTFSSAIVGPVAAGTAPPRTMDGVELAPLPTYGRLLGAPIVRGYREAVERLAPQLIHVHCPNPLAERFVLKMKRRPKLVVSVHADVEKRGFLERLYYRNHRRLLAAADAVVAASPQFAAHSKAFEGATLKPEVIPYGIPDPRGNGHAAEAAAPGGLPDHFVLFAGRLVPYKNLSTLLFAAVGADFPVVIAGDGPSGAALRSQAARLGVSGHVTFTGFVEDLRPLFARARAFVLPSIDRREGFGIVLLEAAAHRVPLITFDLDSGMKLVNHDGETGIVVPTSSGIVGLRDALDRIWDDPALAQRLGENGRAMFEREFTVDRMASSFEALYRKVLAA